MRKFFLFNLLVIGFGGVTGVGVPAHAFLGNNYNSISADQATLGAKTRKTTNGAKFTVEELASGPVTVREYLSPSGTIFGVAWSGRTHADLTKVLGTYAGEYQNAAAATPRVQGRRTSRIKSPNIVVEKWGHMRRLQGHAYIPSFLPNGVTADDIK